MTLQKGICYQPFPPPYNPSMANQTCLFFGSDIAYDAMAPLWGINYTNAEGKFWEEGNVRHDLGTVKWMGADVIRLYDWDPRNLHLNFLDLCQSKGIGVLVPVSNYFLQAGGGFPQRAKLIPELIKSYSNANGTDYHPAVVGIIFGNELAGYGAAECVAFTKLWAEIEASQFPGYREVRLGHPVQFTRFKGLLPCFGFWDDLLPPLQSVTTRNLNQRLFLAPQTYNLREYLFENAEGLGRGWVDLAYEKYATPIWFTEIGRDRTKPDFHNVVVGQLKGCLDYSTSNPNKLIGSCFFQFADKVWMQGTSEGSFGAYAHSGSPLSPGSTITYSERDFTHYDGTNCNGSTMTVDGLNQTPLFDAVTSVYRAR